MNKPLRVGVLGATGSVGQKFVSLLSGHPWFRVTYLAGSPGSQGIPYGERVRWLETTPLPRWAGGLVMEAPSPELPCDLVFSALSSTVASEIESTFVAAGVPVISNASSHRMEPGVPLLVPEVNPDHVEVLRGRPPGEGFMVANPNCSTSGLVLALKPLVDAFGIRRVSVTTLQALSGAGYPGVPSLDILGNVIPNIPNEEEKLETEPLKILGRRKGTDVTPAELTISAQTNRVPVIDGHLLSVSVETEVRCSVEGAADALEGFVSPLLEMALPSAPERPVRYSRDPSFPQPRLHSGAGSGMAVSIGRLRPCPVLGLRFVALVHNTVRGAAGGAILNAEFLYEKGFLRSQLPEPGAIHASGRAG